jgi:MEMO1 family protein
MDDMPPHLFKQSRLHPGRASWFYLPMEPLPAIRPVDLFPVEEDGKTLFCLRDPEGYAAQELVLSPPAFFVACMLTGANDADTIRAQFKAETGGHELADDDILRVVEVLDREGYLYTEAFFGIAQRIADDFRAAPARPARMAGASYPADPAALRAFLDGMFLRENGPGAVPPALTGGLPPLRGLVAPHIDFQRGGHGYAHAYGRLFQGVQPATVWVFGVAHAAPPVPFILTRKGFDTPFGVLETDVAAVDRVAAACSWDPFEYELSHRTEHSVEFQAVMLKYLFPEGTRIVPILCGSFGDAPGASPDPDAERFLDTCAAAVAEGPACVIAAADLAHVGRHFGDDFDISPDILDEVAWRDHEDLRHVTTPDPAAWLDSVMRDGNARRVCGLHCIYAALRALDGSAPQGRILCHDIANDPVGGIVSFAAITLAETDT